MKKHIRTQRKQFVAGNTLCNIFLSVQKVEERLRDECLMKCVYFILRVCPNGDMQNNLILPHLASHLLSRFVSLILLNSIVAIYGGWEFSAVIYRCFDWQPVEAKV